MAGFRFSLVLLSAFVCVQVGRTQTESFPLAPTYSQAFAPPAKAACTDCAVSKVYSLADLGEDPNLCKWIADTIPQMIKPGCWTGKNLCYYAPAKVMAIHQTPEVHAKIEEFLASMRKSLPRAQTTAMKHDPRVAPAQFNPEPLRPIGPPCAAMAYPVPGPMQTPKHLFHFIIRYEGEGIIDSNVTKFTEALTKAASGGASEGNATYGAALPAPPAPFSSGLVMPMASNSAVSWANVNGVVQSRTMPPAATDPLLGTRAQAMPNNEPPPPPFPR